MPARRASRHRGGTVQARMEAARQKREGLGGAPAPRQFSEPRPSTTAEPEFPKRWKRERRLGLLLGLVVLLLAGLGGVAWLAGPDPTPDLVAEVAPVSALPEPVVAETPVATDVTPDVIDATAPSVMALDPFFAPPVPDISATARSVISPIVFRLEPSAPVAPEPDTVPTVDGEIVDPLQFAVSDALAEALQRPAIVPPYTSRRPPARPVIVQASVAPIAPTTFQTDSVLLHLPAAFPAAGMGAILTRLADAGHAPADIRRYDFNVSDTQVRYFREAEAPEAQRIGAALGAEVRDFTWFSPKPRTGQIEVWIAP